MKLEEAVKVFRECPEDRNDEDCKVCPLGKDITYPVGAIGEIVTTTCLLFADIECTLGEE